VNNLGSRLSIVRERLGLSLRDVASRSQEIADVQKSPHYHISASWLRRIESDSRHEVSALRLIALLEIYEMTLEELLAADPSLEETAATTASSLERRTTTLITHGLAEANARLLLPNDSHTALPPEHTQLLRQGTSQRNGRFLRVFIGSDRNYLYPIIPAGTLALVDTHRRSLNLRVNVESEIQRPMFLLELRNGHICCWCEIVDKDDSRIVVLPHPCTRMRAIQLHLGKDASVRGQIVAVRIPTIVEGN
jgi:transcriptional regulator with XRE-family HTH domain